VYHLVKITFFASDKALIMSLAIFSAKLYQSIFSVAFGIYSLYRGIV
jgi:hypothetical protein